MSQSAPNKPPRSVAAAELVDQLRSTRRRRPLAQPTTSTDAQSVPDQAPPPSGGAVPVPDQAADVTQVPTPRETPEPCNQSLHSSGAQDTTDTSPQTSHHKAVDAATIIGYIALALAVSAVVVGGFLVGFHISSYGLAAILGTLAVTRVVAAGNKPHDPHNRSPWVDATVMASAAILLIVLTAGIPTDSTTL